MQADTGVQKLKEKVDTLIVIPNDRLLTVANDKTSVLNAFKMADEVLLQGVSGITNLITTPGLINTDFADVKMILSNAGSALMGIGQASGDEPCRHRRPRRRSRARCSRPAIDGARGILLNITGPSEHGPVRDERGRRDHPRRRPPGRQHHLRHRHRRRDGRRGPVTVIAAGFDRWDDAAAAAQHDRPTTGRAPTSTRITELFGRRRGRPLADDDGDDDFDVPSFLK